MNVTVRTNVGELLIEDCGPEQANKVIHYLSLHLACSDDDEAEAGDEAEADDDAVDSGYVKGFCWPKSWKTSVVAIARDNSGCWYAYRNSRPEAGSTTWSNGGDHFSLSSDTYDLPSFDDWQDSLILNPYIDHEVRDAS